jgi:hypothetical protein
MTSQTPEMGIDTTWLLSLFSSLDPKENLTEPTHTQIQIYYYKCINPVNVSGCSIGEMSFHCNSSPDGSSRMLQ